MLSNDLDDFRNLIEIKEKLIKLINKNKIINKIKFIF